MTDNNIKKPYINSTSNFSLDINKNQIAQPNINSNLNNNFNSYSHENFFNELINSTNCLESKNNSSFGNFSESIQSNQDNQAQNIIMNKEQLYQTFVLFQKFLKQNINNMNNNNSKNNTPKKNDKITANYRKNDIDEINETSVINDKENEELINGKNITKKNKTSHKYIKKNFQNDEDMPQKELTESKSYYNIINGKNIINNGGEDNIIYFKEKENKNYIYKKEKNNIYNLTNNNINNDPLKRKRSNTNSDNINSYDDIPIKFNKENFVDLVEKKLADEKKYENKTQENNDQKKFEHIHKIKQKKDNEKMNQIQHNSSNNKKNKNKTKNNKNKIKINEKKENIIDKDKK